MSDTQVLPVSQAETGAQPGEEIVVRGGMRSFVIIWIGQIISLIGSSLTGFALGVWVYESTGRATPWTIILVFSMLPRIILMPLSGVIADRFNRRQIMILSDTGAALSTAIVALLIFYGDLQIWHIYLMALLAAICAAFQEPAFTASISMLVPKEQLTRANGMVQGMQAAEMLVAPLMAGFLFAIIGLKGIILIDFVTFFFAIGALLIVRIPQPETVESKQPGEKTFWKDVSFGWSYIQARPGLLIMLIYFAFVNLCLNGAAALMGPLVISFAGAEALGIVQMVMGIGFLVGSIVISAWGGTRRKMTAVYISAMLTAVGMTIIGLQPKVWLIGLGFFLLTFSVSIASTSSQTIWMRKVEPGIQGRVFSIRRMIGSSMIPVAFFLSGILADGVFEPMLAETGLLAQSFIGQTIGTGQGRGVGLMFILSGILVLLCTLVALATPRLRLVEDELPDVLPEEGEAPAAV